MYTLKSNRDFVGGKITIKPKEINFQKIYKDNMEITLTSLCVLHANFVFFLPTALLSVYVVPKHYQNKMHLFLFQVSVRLPLSQRNLPVCKRIGKTAKTISLTF